MQMQTKDNLRLFEQSDHSLFYNLESQNLWRTYLLSLDWHAR